MFNASGDPYSGKKVVFTLVPEVYSLDTQWTVKPIKVVTGEDGAFEVSLWANPDPFNPSVYGVTLPDGSPEFLICLPGTDTTHSAELSTLRMSKEIACKIPSALDQVTLIIDEKLKDIDPSEINVEIGDDYAKKEYVDSSVGAIAALNNRPGGYGVLDDNGKFPLALLPDSLGSSSGNKGDGKKPKPLNALQVKRLYESNPNTYAFDDYYRENLRDLLAKSPVVQDDLTPYLKTIDADKAYAPATHTHNDYVPNSELGKTIPKLVNGKILASRLPVGVPLSAPTAAQVTSLYEATPTVERFTPTLKTKLEGIDLSKYALTNHDHNGTYAPFNHNHNQYLTTTDADSNYLKQSVVNQPNGLAGLDGKGKLPTASLSGTDIKQLYESNPDTNPFTNDQLQKLEAIDLNHNRTAFAPASHSHPDLSRQISNLASLIGSGSGGGTVDLTNYYTKAETDAQISDFLTTDVNQAITNAIADYTPTTDLAKNYLTKTDAQTDYLPSTYDPGLGNYYTKAETNTQISTALKGYLTVQVAKQNYLTVASAKTTYAVVKHSHDQYLTSPIANRFYYRRDEPLPPPEGLDNFLTEDDITGRFQPQGDYVTLANGKIPVDQIPSLDYLPLADAKKNYALKTEIPKATDFYTKAEADNAFELKGYSTRLNIKEINVNYNVEQADHNSMLVITRSDVIVTFPDNMDSGSFVVLVNETTFPITISASNLVPDTPTLTGGVGSQVTLVTNGSKWYIVGAAI